MRCCVPNCCNNRNVKNTEKRITFHYFPKLQCQMQAWLEALNMENWTPGEKSAVCSEHFREEDFYENKAGKRRLHLGAVPIEVDQEDDIIKLQDDDDAPAAFRICRICLSVDTKLYHIRDFDLTLKYENITGLSMADSDRRLPQSVCGECTSLLNAAATLRGKALLSNDLLHRILATESYIKMKDIISLKEKHIFNDSETPEAIPENDTKENIPSNKNRSETNNNLTIDEETNFEIEDVEKKPQTESMFAKNYDEYKNFNYDYDDEDTESFDGLIIDEGDDDEAVGVSGNREEIGEEIEQTETKTEEERQEHVKGARKRLDDETKRQIVTLMREGTNIAQVCKLLNVSRGTVKLWWGRWCKEGNTNRHVSLTRRRKASVQDHGAQRAYKDNNVPTKDVTTDLGSSTTTVLKRLRENGLRIAQVAKKNESTILWVSNESPPNGYWSPPNLDQEQSSYRAQAMPPSWYSP